MSYGRAMIWGAAVAIVVVALAVAGVVLTGDGRAPLSTPGDRVMLVLASHDDSGTQVAQVVGILEAGHGDPTLALIDPGTTVTVPGTSYEHLRDAYPFGGGAAVSQAYASVKGGEPLPVVTLTERGLVALVQKTGPLAVGVPEDLDAFDGRRLYTFPQGGHQLRGEDVAGLLLGAEVLPWERAERIDANVATALASALAEDRPQASELLADGRISSTLKEKDVLALLAKVRPGLSRLTVRAAP